MKKLYNDRDNYSFRFPSGLNRTFDTGMDLFNGNIGHATYAIGGITEEGAMGYTYRYDHLNRLTSMRASHIEGSEWDIGSVLEDYAEDISYDANGNILTYFRNGDQDESGIEMDNLTYQYERDLEGRLISNRLRYVHDEVQSNSYTADIKTQTSLSQQDVNADFAESQAGDNYQYDETGNLISDATEGIDRIEWTVYGKIRKITKGTTTIEYGYDAGGNRITKTVDENGTVVTTFYVRDAQGNVLAVYDDTPGDSYVWREQHLYGSSRLGMVKPEWKAPLNPAYNPTSDPVDNGIVGKRVYELSNHLGNVMVTISDIKIGKSTPGGPEIAYYEADVVTAQDYYPFGMGMPGRKFSGSSLYRYGFNGKEQDKETSSTTTYDYGFRIYSPALGRFLTVDPLTKNYPWYTPYQFAGNKPINSIDLDGLEEYESYYAYSQAKGKSALKTMDGSDGAWLASDRKDKTATWSNAMAAITKNKWTDKFKSFSLQRSCEECNGSAKYLQENTYSFGIVRDYYNWVQHEMDTKGFGSRWVKGASYLSDELADTYEEGAASGGFTIMGGILKGLSQDIVGYAVGKFSSVLYGGETVPNTKEGWYTWDANFVMEEQVTKVAPSIYQSYAGTKALNQLNSLVRKEGSIGVAASLFSKHFFPSFAKFGVSVNDPSTQFGAQGRYNIPLLMLYPFTHQAQGGVQLSNEQFKEIWKAHNAINSYYQNSMKY